MRFIEHHAASDPKTCPPPPRSLITLRFIEGRLYLDPIRECYEAFVIYNFYMFLIAYLVRARGARGPWMGEGE